jgi:plastocyanin
MNDRRPILGLVLTLAVLLLGAVAAPAVVQAGGGCHAPDNSVHMEADGTKVIRMDVCSFAPAVSTVPVGTAVRFLNTATNDHAVTGRAGSWGSDILGPGQEFSARFDKVGTYPYACPLHPGMVGAIVVTAEAAGPADLAAPTQPAASSGPAAPATSDPIQLALVGLAGLAVGLGLGAAAMRRRTTG